MNTVKIDKLLKKVNTKFLIISAAFLFCWSTSFCQHSDFKDERFKGVSEYSTRLSMLGGNEYDSVKKWGSSYPTILKIQKDSARNYDEIVVMAVTRKKISEIEFVFSKERLLLQLIGTNTDAKVVTIFYEFDYDLLNNNVKSTEVMQRINY